MFPEKHDMKIKNQCPWEKESIMQKKLGCLIVAALLLAASLAFGADNITPQTGGVFPAVELSKPTDAGHLKYLGLSGGGNFKLNEIKADVLIVEIFSMYCPYCQGEAPNINRLYQSIQNDAALKSRVKIIGIGIGNSKFETEIFKNKYNVAFPLIPDGEFKMHKVIGEVRTPYFFVIKLKGKKPMEVIYSKLGALESNESFLALIKSAGLK